MPLKAAKLAIDTLQYHLSPALGRKRMYNIHAGYRHRDKIEYFDDLENTDGWQREVYETARDLMAREGLRTVTDIGCGSAYKLVHMLGDYDTTGVDLPETIERVRAKYPDRKWISGSFEEVVLEPADLVICSDVIEHVADPAALMEFIVRSTRQWVVLSTPDRELVYGWRNRHRFGPPENPTHVREWNMPEFAALVSRYVEVVEHNITNREQATQTIVGKLRT